MPVAEETLVLSGIARTRGLLGTDRAQAPLMHKREIKRVAAHRIVDGEFAGGA